MFLLLPCTIQVIDPFQRPIKFKRFVFTFNISVNTWRLQRSYGSSKVANYPTHVTLKRLYDDCLSVDFQWPEALIIHQHRRAEMLPLWKTLRGNPLQNLLFFCSFKVGMKWKWTLFSKCMFLLWIHSSICFIYKKV